MIMHNKRDVIGVLYVIPWPRKYHSQSFDILDSFHPISTRLIITSKPMLGGPLLVQGMSRLQEL